MPLQPPRRETVGPAASAAAERLWCPCGAAGRQICALAYLNGVNAHLLGEFLGTRPPLEAAAAIEHIHPKVVVVAMSAMGAARARRVLAGSAVARSLTILQIEAIASRLRDAWEVRELLVSDVDELADALRQLVAQDDGLNPYLLR